jgi:NitT/TauT family transport system ATP-binding protein
MQRAMEKVLAVRQQWAEKNPQTLAALVRAVFRAAEFAEAPDNRSEVARILARGEYIGVDAGVILRTLEGRLKVAADGTMRESDGYMMLARDDASIPDPLQAAWLYAQMVRWRQTRMSLDALKAAQAVFRPDLYEAALGRSSERQADAKAIGTFAGPSFDPEDIQGYVAALQAQ